MPARSCVFVVLGLLATGAAGLAQTHTPTPTPTPTPIPTRVLVRVVAHDAKIIGSGVGGARVVIRDPATGAVLAEGIQQGGTGDTQALVNQPVVRGEPIYDTRGAALFTADLKLDEPKVLEFVGEGPLGYEHAMQRVSKTMLVVPGEDILGNGVLLELNGFIVELLEPSGEVTSGKDLIVEAGVRMMCGCTLEPGGLWDADRVQVRVRLYRGAVVVAEIPLEYAGEPSVFSGTVPSAALEPGLRLVVLASDPSRANFGVSPGSSVR